LSELSCVASDAASKDSTKKQSGALCRAPPAGICVERPFSPQQ
jgi:hypothetical protein